MTIRHLKVFIKICERECNISKASEDLCVAQPSVSQTIKELENYYGVILFDRINKKLVLTEEGELLLAKAKEVVERFDEFEKLANKKDLNPVVRVGATMTFGVFIIPRFKELIEEKCPNIDLRLAVEKPATLEEKILLGELDFGFEEGIIKDENINAIQIGEDELIAICGIDYKAPEKMKLSELVNYPLLLREKNNPGRRILDYQLGIKGLKIKTPLLESVSNSSILSMAKGGSGVGIIPAAVAKNWLANKSIRKIELDTQLKRKLFLITRKNKVMNQSVKAAYSLAKEILDIVKRERDEKK